MAPKRSQDPSSPVTPSLAGLRPRRGSLASLASRSSVSKQSFVQALDQIHTSASQSEALTTFNDFVPPPGASSGGGKGIGGDIVQAGLTGLYTRIKASVGAIQNAGRFPNIASDNSGIDGVTSDKCKTASKPLILPDSFTSQSQLASEPSSGLHSPLVTTFGLTANGDSASANSATLVSSTSGSARVPAATTKFQLTPFTQAGSSTAARATTDYVSVSAIRDGSMVSTSASDTDMLQAGSMSGLGRTQPSNKAQLGGDELIHYRQARDLVDKDGSLSKTIGKNGEPSTGGNNGMTSSALETPQEDLGPVSGAPVDSSDNYNKVNTSGRDTTTTPSAKAHLAQQAQADMQSPSPRTLTITGLMPGRSPLLLNNESAQLGSDLARSASIDLGDQASVSAPSSTLPAVPSSSTGQSGNGKGRKLHISNKNPSLMGVEQVKRSVLSRDFWMKDENAKDCFYCGKPFSTFRRKHHCRLCGQIFDNGCTSLVPGRPFGQSANIRICKLCKKTLHGGSEDSSDCSEEGDTYKGPPSRPLSTIGLNDYLDGENFIKASRSADNALSDNVEYTKLATPTRSIPVSRRIGESERRSAVLEYDNLPALARPSSSRSLKSLKTRPYSSSHKLHASRHQYMRGLKSTHDDRVPFQGTVTDETKASTLPVFHQDSIIDPDLAPFLSDDGSSGEEQASIFATMNDHEQAASTTQGENGLNVVFVGAEKSRHNAVDKNNEGNVPRPDLHNMSLSSARAGHVSRLSRRRNLSAGSFNHVRPSTRVSKSASILQAGSTFDDPADQYRPSISKDSPPAASGDTSQVITSSAMRGADAPAVELNNASLDHVRKLLKQLLQDARVPHVSHWEKALVPILLQCTDDVDPDVQHGDDIDIRSYVKIKKIPGGRPGDTAYVSGVVFSKNVALKSMPRHILQPRIVILTFPVEYSRHGHHFMSLEPVIAQEREYLRNLVNRILALHPQVLLVQGNVAGHALEYLEEAKVAVAYNVKTAVLNAVARCTQTRRISSVNQLTVEYYRPSKCSSFDVKTYVHQGVKKSFIFLSGCHKELGCTVVLRGAEIKTLRTVKSIAEFMCYVVYNLKLETCLMRDEFVLIPSRPHGKSASPTKGLTERAAKAAQDLLAPMKDAPSLPNNQLPDRFQQPETSVSSSLADIINNSNNANGAVTFDSSTDHVHVPKELMPVRTFYSNMVEKHQTKILSASPFVRFVEPYLLMKVREQESLILHFKRLLDLDAQEEIAADKEASSQGFCLVSPEMIYSRTQSASKQIREILHALHQAEYDDAMHKYLTQKKQWEHLIANNQSLFDPFAHQSIVVLFGIVCTPTSVPCNGPDIHVLEYYSNEHNASEPQACDSTLGQYVEDVCHSAHSICNANGCDKKMLDHHRQYVHGDGQVSIFAQYYSSRIRGLQNTILMWSCCRICGKETQVLPMSDNTWKYSFGKYLELSFLNTDLHARASICPHDIHRNHVRFFGFMDIAVRVQYDQINLFEIRVPRTTITWKIDSDLRLKNDQFRKIEERLNRFVSSVKARIQSIQLSNVIPEKSQACKAELDKMTKRANDEHKFLIEKLQAKYMTAEYYECIPLNRAIRAMQEKVAEWDTTFMELERNFFPSERDIRRLATSQFKKLFIDREEAISSFSSEEGAGIPLTETGEVRDGERKLEDMCSGMPSGPIADPVQTGEASPAIVAGRQGDPRMMLAKDDRNEVNQHSAAVEQDLMPRRNLSQALEREAIRPLDLAVPPTSQDGQHDSGRAASSFSEAGCMTSPHSDETVGAFSVGDVGALNPTLSEKTEQMRAAAVRSESFPVVFESRIPRPFDFRSRLAGTRIAPPLNRAQSQPPAFAKSLNTASESSDAPIAEPTSLGHVMALNTAVKPESSESTAVQSQKLSDKIDLPGYRSTKLTTHSLIPRSVQTYIPDTKVSLLAKHFEQLSREFEKERLRERRLWAERNRQSRAYPVALSRPVVEVYRDTHEAEHGTTTPEERIDNSRALSPYAQVPADSRGRPEFDTIPDALPQLSEVGSPHDKRAELTNRRDETQPSTEPTSDGEEERIDTERASLDEGTVPEIEEKEEAGASEPQLDQNLELPKHQKISFMKMLTSFWSERSSSGWAPLEYPLIPTDHVFVDSDIIVREDEPSSLIAFVLASQSYQIELQKIQKLGQANRGRRDALQSQAPERTNDTPRHFLTRGVDRHVDVAFQEGTAKMSCKAWYAGSFDALRRECGVSHRIVEALSRCLKWDSKGGRTKSLFLKTLDERFILKSLSATEQAAFKDLAFDYFKYMAEVRFEGVNSAIAKIVGLYDVKITNPSTGVEFERSLLVMENLFYDCNPGQRFDLKGSMRNRKVQSTGEQDEVLLDENMVEFIYEKPIFVRQHSKSLFTRCIKNDTAFLAARNVMDYSLMLGFDEEKNELVVGLIDYIRTYTWDKKLESWIKDRGKNKPTITSPIDYRNRFKGSMSNYVLVAPNCWHQFRRGNAVPVRTCEKSRVKVEEPSNATGLHGNAERAGSPDKELVDEEEKTEMEQKRYYHDTLF